MSLYHSSRYKLRNIERTIDSLLEGDFPLDAGREALHNLRDVFTKISKRLDRANVLDNPANLVQVAQVINLKILQSLPILGFILRSTNVRNAFEMLEPLHAIASNALQGKPRLILSSEWDYVPFAYPQSLDSLKSFILIGLPASEAASALLMPVAGHELGHAVWRHYGIGASLQQDLQTKCFARYGLPINREEFSRLSKKSGPNDLFGPQLVEEAVEESSTYAGFQAEELFCDLFAYACFGPSYLRAFAYIVAPGDGVTDAKYPRHSTRVGVIRNVASKENVTLPTLEELGFIPDGRRGDAQHQFMVRMAEGAVADIMDDLWQFVVTVIGKGGINRPQTEKTKSLLRSFKVLIPSEDGGSVGDIINAGWERYDEIISTGASMFDQLAQLNEVLLKTIEVFEYNRRIGR